MHACGWVGLCSVPFLVLVLPGPQRDHIAVRPRQPSDRDSRSSLPAKRPELPLDVASTVTSTTARPRQQSDRRSAV
jgi:hypothetical protein